MKISDNSLVYFFVIMHKIYLALFICIVGTSFAVVGIYLCTHTEDVSKNDQLVVPEALQSDINFVIGQYYFNHDDDPGGPYDLVMARKYFEAAIAQDPKSNLELWYQLGRIDFIEGKFDEALKKFDIQLEYYGYELPNVFYMIGLTYGYKARQTNNLSDWEKGEDAFTTFIDIMPVAPWSRVDLAWIYFSQGKYEEMKPVLEVGLQHRPGNAWLLNMYGLSLLNTGYQSDALVYLTEAKKSAANLTEADWGNSYPGNNPEAWGQGLSEFRTIIQRNIDLVKSE